MGGSPIFIGSKAHTSRARFDRSLEMNTVRTIKDPDVSMRSMENEEARIRDAYARRAAARKEYSWFDAGYLFMIQQLERRVLISLARHGMVSLHSKHILEVGCGNGHWLREFLKWGATPENLAGIDLLPERIEQACRLSPSGIAFTNGNATELGFPDESFEIVLQATVFTSILNHAVKKRVAAEMLRVLKPDGLLLWYDFRINNPRNPDVRGIGKAEIEKLFPNCWITLEKITLAPPLLRFLAPYTWLGSYVLSAIPWACTHYLGTIRKPVKF
jgi:ubiquinone/menaquinone biosynthesis C-methylase UbiE